MKFDVIARYDVIVIGSGVSGLICAIELARKNKTVYLITKEAVTESSSLYAQGGIAIPLAPDDSQEKHIKDTIKAGTYLCNKNVAKEIISFSKDAFQRLMQYGISFDLNPDNTIHQSLEACHSYKRVCHVTGDATGKSITKTLIENACLEPNISISQGTTCLDILLNEEGEAAGILAHDITKRYYVVVANDIVVATGGLGQLFLHTTNPFVSCGDGIALAYKCGAYIQDPEMIQFHPTVCLENGEPFLISEAIRGEGGKLKNINGEYFAVKYHKEAELAPRDILARAIFNEMKKTRSNFVYLDLSGYDTEYFKKRFPTVYHTCIERKIDLFKTGIPVAPACHYFIGGIKCDLYGKTNIPSLWVVGECASNGMHGANRLASNSLLECICSPHFLITELLYEKTKEVNDIKSFDLNTDDTNYTENEITELKNKLKEKNSVNLGLIRKETTLSDHLKWLDMEIKKHNAFLLSLNPSLMEYKNMLILSRLICYTALMRNYNLGVHFREDCRDMSVKYEHSILSNKEGLFWQNEESCKIAVSF